MNYKLGRKEHLLFEKFEEKADYDSEDFDHAAYEDAVDKLYKRSSAASGKRLAPLFIYSIIEKYSSEEKHLKIKEIVEILKERYDVVIERKAVSRIVIALAEHRDYAVSFDEKGAWKDEYQF